MSAELDLIRRLEAADALELAQMIAGATGFQERVLREHLGDERFHRMRERAVRMSLSRGKRSVRGNVVVIHGILGGELSTLRGTDQERIWISLPRIVLGGLARLQLDSDGVTDRQSGAGAVVRATGILKKYYGELLLFLAEDWNVRPFFFDWRKSLDLAAAELNDSIVKWFGTGAPVHLVAHSMGGLVARTLIANHRDTWNRMWDEPSAGQRGGRLLMLGTPNHGSFAIPQMITGLEPLVRKLELLDLKHNLADLKQVFSTFPGSLQMLPSPFLDRRSEPLYQAKTYEPLVLSQNHLTAALEHHAKLRPVIDPDRMSYVAGCNQPTFSYVEPTLEAMSNIRAYAVTRDGDGRVPHRLGCLDKVATTYLDLEHGALASHPSAFSVIHDLLEHGKSEAASTRRATTKKTSEKESKAMLDEILARYEREQSELSAGVMHRGRRTLDAEQAVPTSEERRAEELVVRGILGDAGDTASHDTRVRQPTPPGPAASTSKSIRISIRVVPGSIADFGGGPRDALAPDALAAGHYPGVAPQAAAKILDGMISSALPSEAPRRGPSHAGVVAQFAARGILRGRLGELFFINIEQRGQRLGGKDRLACILGLGEPGRLGVAELTVAVRELCWSLDRLGRSHLASVLIGAGPGNLSIPDAVNAWVRGVRRALTERGAGSMPGLRALTFVEWDPERIGPLNKALKIEMERERAEGFHIELKLPSDAAIVRLRKKRLSLARRERTERESSSGRSNGTPATVMIVTREKDGYLFSAMTDSASVPERKVAADHTLVLEANQRLASAAEAAEQEQLGRFLHQLIVPEALRTHLCSSSPLVMVVDATTARIHWEMLADGGTDGESPTSFLGTHRGLTRRLRTDFAPPPEPLTPPERELRVLVVADPAEDQRLPGAALEGLEVAKLFEAFNRVHGKSGHKVVVTRMIGPEEATRLKVLMALTQHHYDVLHFAGHCAFDPDNENESGWVFSGGTRLAARELNRIDRIPRFVFSNACESGITPERASARSKAAAPSFAEAFFARGVANFVCTAWEIGDEAALAFALRLYRELLGLQESEPRFADMAEALKKARSEIFSRAGGSRTWGAYQHYGTPGYRFFDKERRQR